jgi:hypothetical protein
MWLQRIFRPKSSLDVSTKPGERRRKLRAAHLSGKAVRQLERLQLSGSKTLRGESIGQRPSHRRKPASDFMDHRMYVPGDDIRYVDWRASARHENVFIRQGELPKDVTVYLIMDCSESMLWGDDPKRRAQLELTAALGYLTLSNRDRLRVYPYGGTRNKPLGPISGKGQVSNFLNYINQLNYGKAAGLSQAVKSLSRQTSRGGLVFILSDLLDIDSISPILENFPSPFWIVNVFHILHPEELQPGLLGNVEMVDSETGDSANYDVSKGAIKRYTECMNEWQNRFDMECVEKFAFYSIFLANWQVDREMIAHLRSTKVVIPR